VEVLHVVHVQLWQLLRIFYDNQMLGYQMILVFSCLVFVVKVQLTCSFIHSVRIGL